MSVGLAVLACFQGNLRATSCVAPPPPCAIIPAQGIWFTGVVEDANVVASNDLYPYHIRYRVDEIFSGLEPGVKEVALVSASGPVEKGLSYLVSARRLGDILIVDTCSVGGMVRSNPYVDYLRKAAAGELPPTASLTIRILDGYGGRPDATVTFVGPDGELTAQTDLNGVAKLEGIKPGRYRLVYDEPRYRVVAVIDQADAWAGSCPSLVLRLR